MNESVANSKSSVKYNETPEEITVHIRGKVKDGLDKIASAMNKTSWCDSDNTAASVLDAFVIGYWLRQLETPAAKYHGISLTGISEITSDIVNGIYTGFDDGTEEDRKRKAELSAAFETAGV